VDHAVVAFLVDYEASGASMRNCPAYIREWIGAEQAATESYRVSPHASVLLPASSL